MVPGEAVRHESRPPPEPLTRTGSTGAEPMGNHSGTSPESSGELSKRSRFHRADPYGMTLGTACPTLAHPQRLLIGDRRRANTLSAC